MTNGGLSGPLTKKNVQRFDFPQADIILQYVLMSA